MQNWFQTLKSLEITSPFLLPVGLVLVAAVIVGIVRKNRKNRGDVDVSEIDSVRQVRTKRVKTSKVFNYASFFLIAALLAAMFTGPRSELQASVSESKTQYIRNVMMVIDISSSMKSRYGGFVADEEDREQSSYEAVAQSGAQFLRNQQDMRVGIVFYSIQNFVWRRPTVELDLLADDLERTNIGKHGARVASTSDIGSGQLEKISQGTETVPALYKAAGVFSELGEKKELQSRTVILLTDLQDKKDEVSEAIKELSKAGIRVYVLSSDTPKGIEEWRKPFIGNNSVRFFSIRSDEEMREAYKVVEELESEPIIVNETTVERRNMVPGIALALLVFSTLFVLVSERFARHLRGGGRNEG